MHDELRRIARRCMAGERHGHTLQATALVNEAYLRLVDARAWLARELRGPKGGGGGDRAHGPE